MRIMLDTNVLISALLFPSMKMNSMIESILLRHRFVLCSYVIEELVEVVKRKFPTKEKAIYDLLNGIKFEYIKTPDMQKKDLFKIRDVKDYPVLYSAIIGKTDILITGDKDFSDIIIEKPEILSPSQFIMKYCSL